MFRFLCRLSLKMIADWKKEILLVMLGIVISSCAVIKFTDSLSNFKRYYDDVKGTREERIFHENRVHFRFPDSRQLPEIVEKLKGQEGIRNVILKGDLEIVSGCDFPVAFYSSIPILTEHDNSIGRTPEHVQDGTIVLSYRALCGLEGRGPEPEEGIVVTYDETTEESPYTIFYSCDQKFPMAGQSYQIVGENFNFEENLLSLNDLMELDQMGKLSGLELIYIYDDDFGDSQMEQAKELIRSVRSWEDTYREQPENTLTVSDYLDMLSDLIIGVVLAVLNALFIYQSILKRRMPSYAVLKLLGLKNLRLRVIILLEMVAVFAVSYLIAVLLFLAYCGMTGDMLYNLRYSIGYSFCLLLTIYVLLSVVMTARLGRSQPFEAYVVNR